MTLSTSAVAVCCARFAQLIEQARILDGDDRLVGEARQEFNLLVSKQPNRLAINGHRAYELVVLEHGDNNQRSDTS